MAFVFSGYWQEGVYLLVVVLVILVLAIASKDQDQNQRQRIVNTGCYDLRVSPGRVTTQNLWETPEVTTAAIGIS